jgi:hypothetical protein
MLDKMCIVVENARNSKLLALLNTLEEQDKDIVIKISELLFEKCKKNMMNIISNSTNNVLMPPLADKRTYPLDMGINVNANMEGL